jgi:6-phosphofructokinase 1
MTNAVKRVAINTGGGDAPGLNAVIHGAVYAARGLGWQIFGIRDGYDGFMEPQNYPDGGLSSVRLKVPRVV